MPLIGLLLLGMTFATGILAGHLCLDVINSLQEAAERHASDDGTEAGGSEDHPAWRERLLGPWRQPDRETTDHLTRGT